MNVRTIALFGRRDEPTDAVDEYCRYLGGALRDRGVEMETARVLWAERGWARALRELRERASAWRGRWVFLQYTALAWSARGFPLRFLRVVQQLRDGGARVGVVYHDVESYAGGRVVDMVRRRTQLHVMRRTLTDVELAVFTVPLHVVSWIGRAPSNGVFIPVGANLPVIVDSDSQRRSPEPGPPRIAVFGITGGEPGRKECERIADALRFAAAKSGRLQLHAFGRGANHGESYLREALRDAPVEVRVEGILSADQVVRALSCADVALFVRGAISSRRGSAIAGIACGLPVIAFAGTETAPPVTDAGVVLVSPENTCARGEALLRVLSDQNLRASLAERSRKAQREHFGWGAIADRYVEALNKRG
jgi:glycosyltransferase involved in cell wall biosynthesis